CEVCAVSLPDVQAALAKLLSSKPKLISLEPRTVNDVWEDIQRVAEALSAPERGITFVAQSQARMDAIRERAEQIDAKPTVACIDWIDPLMAAGNWVPELVKMVGGQNLFGEVGEHSPWLDWKDLRQADPDIIVLMPCGFDLVRTVEEAASLWSLEGWADLKAVQSKRLYATDGNAYFNRPGPRLVDSMEILAEIIHPGAFAFGYVGSGWVGLETAS
ncbi:MAG: ABC transporter substrate-binding protein, partial [Chloroflexi bacterium]|nr:ABC transporter substrate-binding protein [Chloroflexota bacterium]